MTYRSTRRGFLKAVGLGMAGVIAADRLAAGVRLLPGSGGSIFYVGTFTSGGGAGIYRCRLNLSSGALTVESVVGGVTNASFLAIDKARGRLFAVNETAEFEGKPGGGVSAFALNPETGDLRFLNSRSTHGADPCHVTVDGAGRFILVANYAGGSVAVLPVQGDGSLGEATDIIEHKGSSVKPRQQGPHAHSINLDRANMFAYVADLGLDRVMIYSFDSQKGKLFPATPAWEEMKAGAGPRHLAFHPDGQKMYVVNELDSTLNVYSIDRKTGALEQLQTISTLPPDFSGDNLPADVHVSPSGRYVYCSNRGHDSIAVFAVNQKTGTVSAMQFEPTGGKWPRNFAIEPTGLYLLVANQKSDTITMFTIDRQWGALTPSGEVAKVPAPACIAFL